MSEPLEARDWSTLSRIDLEFHTTIVKAGENSRLLRAYQTLATEALICLNHFQYSYPRPERVVVEHREIAAGLRSGGMDELHAMLHDHLSISSFELHSHDAEGDHRHGRNES
jgi:DNA-binding GntR family transcriptional regulator